jgi:hypothetical protein
MGVPLLENRVFCNFDIAGLVKKRQELAPKLNVLVLNGCANDLCAKDFLCIGKSCQMLENLPGVKPGPSHQLACNFVCASVVVFKKHIPVGKHEEVLCSPTNK